MRWRIGLPKKRNSIFSCDRYLRNSRGATIVDYLMMTAAVAGIGFPLVIRFLGGPINDSLLSQRQTLVDFVAQNRKQKVPNAWFSQENQGATGGEKQLGNVKNFDDPQVNEAGQVGNPGQLAQAQVAQPQRLNAGRLNEPGQVQVGNTSGGGGGGGGGGGAGGGAGGAGGAAGSGSSNLNGDFFGKDGGGGSGNLQPDSEGKSGGANYGNGSKVGGAAGGSSEGESDSSGGSKGNKAKGGDDKNATSSGIAESKRSIIEGIRRTEEEQARRRGEFNWWMLLKILIFVLILFLILLIALSNARKG